MTVNEDGAFAWVFCGQVTVQEVIVTYAAKDELPYDHQIIWRLSSDNHSLPTPLVFGREPEGWATTISPTEVEPTGNYIDISADQIDDLGNKLDSQFGSFDGDQLVVGKWLGADGNMRPEPCGP